MAPQPTSQIGTQVMNDPGFVSATRSAAREDESDLGSSLGTLHSPDCRVVTQVGATVEDVGCLDRMRMVVCLLGLSVTTAHADSSLHEYGIGQPLRPAEQLVEAACDLEPW